LNDLLDCVDDEIRLLELHVMTAPLRHDQAAARDDDERQVTERMRAFRAFVAKQCQLRM